MPRPSPSGSPRDASGAELREWVRQVGLQRHAEKLLDPDGRFGFSSLLEVRDLTEREVQDVSEQLGMNLGERKRFAREVLALSGARSVAPAAGAQVFDLSPPRKEPQGETAKVRSRFGRERESSVKSKAFPEPPAPPEGVFHYSVHQQCDI